jgi:hypothetical protein
MDTINNRIKEQLVNIDDYRVYVNRANLTIDVIYTDSITNRPKDNWDKPATHMMLIKETSLEDFFSKNTMPSDSAAIVATLSASTDKSGNIAYSYTYDLSTFLTLQLREVNKVDELQFVLVPVSVTTNSSTGAITSIRQLQTISATRIRSAHNSVNPMDIEMIYCSFNRNH